MSEKILVVEDEETIADSIRYSLEKEGYAVVVAEDGEAAIELARREQPSLVLLDLLLPKRDGWQVCRALRREMSTPILMVTAKAEEVDRVIGLEMGADDYIVKPFSMRELIARIRAALRRVRMERTATPPALEFGKLRIDVAGRLVFVSGERVELTPKEFDLLRVLASQPNIALRRDFLLRAVWGENFFGDEKTLDVHVRRLREKIEPNPARPRYVQTVRGVGYKLVVSSAKCKV
jgi:DNA-binding response OmpR family regulator